MKVARVLPVFMLIAAVSSLAVFSGQTASPSNADIISLLDAKLPEGTIVKLIEQSDGKNLDDSATALIALSKKGAGQNILDAVIAAKARSRSNVATQLRGQDVDKRPIPGQPAAGEAVATTMDDALPAEAVGLNREPGVYYRTQGKWVALEQVQSQKTTSHRSFVTRVTGIGSIRYTVEFRGSNATTQIAESRPTLYIRLVPAISDLPKLVPTSVIARLDSKRDKREVEVQAITTTTWETGKGNIKVILKQVATDIVSVTPHADLEPGEYLLNFGYPNGGYDFGIIVR